MSRRHVVSLMCVPAVLSACYRYASAGTAAPTPGAEVRFALAPNATPELLRRLGDGAAAVEGRVTSAADSGYVLAVSGVRKQGETGMIAWAGEHVLVPQAAIAGVERRKLDKKRTFGVMGLAILAAAGIGLIVDAFGGDAGGNDGGEPPPPP